MKKQEIINALAARQAASFCRVVVNRPVEVLSKLAEQAGDIRKETEYKLQLAIYARRKPVKDAVDAGQRDAPELPSHIAKAEIAGNGLKFWIGHSGQEYLALPVFGDNANFKVKWTRNGKPVKVESIVGYLTSAEKREITRASTEKLEKESQGQAVARGVKLENVKEILLSDK